MFLCHRCSSLLCRRESEPDLPPIARAVSYGPRRRNARGRPTPSRRDLEDTGGLYEGHPMFLAVPQVLPRIPRKHISVYTLIIECRQLRPPWKAAAKKCHTITDLFRCGVRRLGAALRSQQ